MTPSSRILAAVLLAAAVGAQATQSAAPGQAPAPNATRIVLPDDLPEPELQSDVVRIPAVEVARAPGWELTVPSGFRVDTYAEGMFAFPRWVVRGEDRDVFVADAAGRIVLLRDVDGNGRIGETEHFVYASGMTRPFGMAVHDRWLLVANTNGVVRLPYRRGATSAIGPAEPVVPLPEGSHWTRNLVVHPDGQRFYVAVGSTGNLVEETDRRYAAINEYAMDGSQHRVFASGLRVPVGLAWRPGSTELLTSVNERDRLGDDLVPDYITAVRPDAHYGWPYAYIGAHEDPRRAGKRPDIEKRAVVPDLLIESHAAALGLVFYDGASATIEATTHRTHDACARAYRHPPSRAQAQGR